MRFAPALAVSMVIAAVVAQTADERARELYRRREFSEASKALEEHLRAKPGDAAARLLLGLSYQQSGDLPGAEAVFRAVPRRADARFYLARVLYERARFAEAKAAASDARGLGYPASRVMVLIGLIRLEQARFGESLAAFQQAQGSAQENDAEPWIQAGKLLLKMGRTAEAVRSLETAAARAGAGRHRECAGSGDDGHAPSAGAVRRSLGGVGRRVCFGESWVGATLSARDDGRRAR